MNAAERAAEALHLPHYQQRLAALGRELIVDLDDTLNTNHVHFRQARTDLLAVLEGLDVRGRSQAELESELARMDEESIAARGYGVRVFRDVCHRCGAEAAGRTLTAAEGALIEQALEPIADVGVLYPGVARTLEALKRAGVPMLLKTKGWLEGQQQKVDAHGLQRYFALGVEIVPAKTAETFRALAATHGLRAPVSIGDSARADILPALDAGYDVIWIERDGAWEHDRVSDPRMAAVPTASSFPEAVKLLCE